MSYVFAPGCALMIYKPQLSQRVLGYLHQAIAPMEEFLTCCRHDDHLPDGTTVINTCAGCNRRYKSRRAGLSTISLWELLSDRDDFPFPDYGGAVMTVLDACPTRSETGVHLAVRKLLHRMNIQVVEPERTMTTGTCCGDSFYPALPVMEVNRKMKQRANEMPAEDVCVYCVSCVKSVHIGGKTPRYLVDLLFGEPTDPGTCETELWHAELDAFISEH